MPPAIWRPSAKSFFQWISAGLVVWAIVLGLVFLLASCSHYNPALYPSYDVLNPGAAVRLNPLGFTDLDPATKALVITWDATLPPALKVPGLYVVNADFLAWVDELKQEVLKLRKQTK